MVNMLDYIKKSDDYKKYEIDELLFVEFKCPDGAGKSAIWWHNNFFAYILEGETIMKTPQREYLLKPGDCIFAKKGSIISIGHSDDEFCELMVFVPDDFIKSVIYKYKILIAQTNDDNPDTVILLSPDDNILLVYFQSLLSYFTQQNPPPESLLKLKFEELIVHIVSHTAYAPLQCYFNELCANNRPPISEIMEANFSSNLSLAEFARLCARSLSGFKREFLAIYHTTPGKWLVNKRLEYSRYLLETTRLSIEEVCFESGFENRSHFIRTFKNKFGTTPGKINLRPQIITS